MVNAPSKDEVSIHIDGPKAFRPELLAIVRNNFEVIHADYHLQPISQVYPPGLPEQPLNLGELEALKNDRDDIFITNPGKGVIKTRIAEIVGPTEVRLPQFSVFLSYARKERRYIDELCIHLAPAEREGLIRTWYDGKIIGGQDWEEKILDELAKADLVICQISPRFLASEFCMRTELKSAIERKKRGEAELIAYVVRVCAWEKVPSLAQFQMLPKDNKKVLREWRDRDRFWHSVAEGIKEAIQELQAKRLGTSLALGKE